MTTKLDPYLERNAQRPCEVTGCHRPRRHTLRFCANHARKQAAYGHPLGKPLLQGDLAQFDRAVAAFLKRQAGNEFIAAAEAELAQYVRTVPRLRAAGVTGATVLPRLLAVWSLNEFAPLKSDDAFTYALGRAILTAAPFDSYRTAKGVVRYHRIGSRALRQAGSLVRAKPLCLFMHAAATAVLASSQRASHRASVLARTTFDVPAPPPAPVPPAPVTPPPRRIFRIVHS